MAEKTIAVQTESGQNGASAAVPATREPGRYLIPPVDIYETAEGLTLLADLPGVAPDAVKVNLEKNVLTIEAAPEESPQVGDALSREFDTLPYYRAFEMNAEIDQQKIAAELKNGVLTLRLPKSEAAKPRQIPVAVK